MARIPPILKKKKPWLLRLFLFFYKHKYGKLSEPIILWSHTPTVFFNFLLMNQSLNRKDSPLNPILRALITVRISQINQCAFCVDMNSFLLLERGGSREKLEAITNFQHSSLFSEKEKVAIEYAEVMTSSHVSNELFDRLKAHYDDDAIIEL
ncbi:MAG: carboxymuconolactone decarboxylase family protein, partial [Chlamydiales bacterium]|nr:carboxymuconolactone decarboxylase family protein [Chlamydiales bacterium]